MKRLLNKIWNAPAKIADFIWQWRAVIALIIITIACFAICYQPRVVHPAPVEADGGCVQMILMSTDNQPVPLCTFLVPEGTPYFTTWGNPIADGVYDAPAALILNVTFRKGTEYWALGVIIIKGEVNLFGPLYLVTYKRLEKGEPWDAKFWVYPAADACAVRVTHEEFLRAVETCKGNLARMKP